MLYREYKVPSFAEVVQSERKSFLVSVWEVPEKVSYESILGWLGLNQEVENSNCKSRLEKISVKEVGGCAEKMDDDEMARNQHVENVRLSQHKPGEKDGGKTVVEVEESCLGKEKNTEGVQLSHKCNGK
ncbi:hypothetical protein QYF36_025822 [Acer negundo]|nr:hypothetical protein QYF36_025822 [Acer negundo]